LEQNIEIWINKAEETWLDELHPHVDELFSTTFLPSHDHTHHRRVWNLCKQVLKGLDHLSKKLTPSLVEALLVAVYFHDVGMVRSTRKDHGRLGRELCESYFNVKNRPKPPRYDELLDAIEKHDVKEARIYPGFGPDESPGILGILSMADDLEALGIIGIYRYTEIYLKRDCELSSLGIRVLGNASTRYENLATSCSMCPSVLKPFKKQYKELISFFDSYNQQILMEPKPEKVMTGNIGIVNYIKALSIEGETGPEGFISEIEKRKPTLQVAEYFTKLKKELQNARL